jgi:hypothetical protein
MGFCKVVCLLGALFCVLKGLGVVLAVEPNVGGFGDNDDQWGLQEASEAIGNARQPGQTQAS